MIDRNSGPLHEQVATTLRDRILSREMQGTLPSESHFRDEFQVSRSVIRQALGTLEAEGLIVKSQGRSTLIKSPKRLRRLAQSLNGLGMQAESHGLPVQTRVLDWETDVFPATPVGRENPAAIRFRRLRLVDGVPFAAIDTKVPAELMTGLERSDLVDVSLHDVLRASGLRLGSSTRSIVAIPARADLATLLEVPVGSPLLVMEGTTLDAQGKLVEEFTTYHRADRVAFEVRTD